MITIIGSTKYGSDTMKAKKKKTALKKAVEYIKDYFDFLELPETAEDLEKAMKHCEIEGCYYWNCPEDGRYYVEIYGM